MSSDLSEKNKENIEIIIGRLDFFIDKPPAYERMIIQCLDMENLLLDIHNKAVDEDLSAKNLTCFWKAISSLQSAENALRGYFLYNTTEGEL